MDSENSNNILVFKVIEVLRELIGCSVFVNKKLVLLFMKETEVDIILNTVEWRVNYTLNESLTPYNICGGRFYKPKILI